jgi:glycosyltransferase involved in cell wall biosynthesis
MKFIYNKTPFVVVSQSTLDDFKKRGFNTSNFSIIYNAIEKNNFPFKIISKTDYPSITYFGRLKKYKSVDHLFYAFANVQKLYPNAMLKIIGRGDYRAFLENLAKKLNIENNVEFLGFVSDEEKAAKLASSHIVVNTSLKEG